MRPRRAIPSRYATCSSVTERTRCARAVTPGWIRWASASRVSTPSASGGRQTARRPSTRQACCSTARRWTGPRRTVLRGLGAAVALPLLDAMVPALTAAANTPAKAVPRLGVIYHPNGVIYENWLPKGAGRGFELSPVLQPLEPFREQLVVVTG